MENQVEQTEDKELEFEDLKDEYKSNQVACSTPIKPSKEVTRNYDGLEHCEICYCKSKKTNYLKKIPHTGDKASLDRCG